jgi:hypothetical protein
VSVQAISTALSMCAIVAAALMAVFGGWLASRVCRMCVIDCCTAWHSCVVGRLVDVLAAAS